MKFVQSEPSKIMSQKLRATFKPFSHILRSKLTSLSDNDINVILLNYIIIKPLLFILFKQRLN